ncbi:MAG: GNAT family N-acetyltransferase, partial [Myxococcota bacterium]
VDDGYISMLVVAPEYRGRGIGRTLVEQIMGDDPQITWVVRAGREGSDGFWAAMGFVPSSVAMERTRAKPAEEV